MMTNGLSEDVRFYLKKRNLSKSDLTTAVCGCVPKRGFLRISDKKNDRVTRAHTHTRSKYNRTPLGFGTIQHQNLILKTPCHKKLCGGPTQYFSVSGKVSHECILIDSTTQNPLNKELHIYKLLFTKILHYVLLISN